MPGSRGNGIRRMTLQHAVLFALLGLLTSVIDFRNPLEMEADAFAARLEQTLKSEPGVFHRICSAAAAGKIQFGRGGADWGPEHSDELG